MWLQALAAPLAVSPTLAGGTHKPGCCCSCLQTTRLDSQSSDPLNRLEPQRLRLSALIRGARILIGARRAGFNAKILLGQVAELSAQAFRRLMGSISDALEDNINQYKESPKAGSQPGTPTFNRAVSTGPSVLSRTLSSAARVPLATAHWKRRMSARRRAIYCRGSLPRASLDLLRVSACTS